MEKVTYARTGATLDPTYVRRLEFEEGVKMRLAVSADLKPADIDWDNSRMLRPLPYEPWQHQLLAHVRGEVLRTDLERAFPMLRTANAAEETRTDEAPADAKDDAREEASPPIAADREDIARPIGEGEGNPGLIAPIAACESEASAHEASAIAASEGAHSQTSQEKAALELAIIRRKKAEQWKTWVTDNAPKIRATYRSFTQAELADELFELAKKQKIDIPGQGSVVVHISFLEHAGLLSKREPPLPKRARPLSKRARPRG